jgi:putative copper export protein
MITIVTMNWLAIRTTILWIHAIGGVAWIGASACFVIVASVTGTDDEEGRAMIRRIASAIDRVGLAAFLFILLSGIVNLYIAGRMRSFLFSDTFIEVLAAKIGIYLAMFAILTASFRAEAKLQSPDATASARAISRLLLLNVAVMLLGATALLLGLWLLGA